MSRKQAYWYLAIGVLVSLMLLFVLAMVNVWLMLLVLLGAVLCLGFMKRNGSRFFEPFRKRPASARPAPVSQSAPRVRQLRPTLVLAYTAAGSDGQIVIDKPEFTIGRGETCDYVVRDTPSVSRVHAVVRVNGDAAFITDNNSQNGTFVNNVRLPGGSTAPLAVGDVVQLGELRLAVQLAQL